MLSVKIDRLPVGALDRHRDKTYAFSYAPDISPANAVSLTMPPRVPSYMSSIGHLHPIFDMNLPEGFLRQWLAKTMPDFDDLRLLTLTGSSQIGRLRYESDLLVPASMGVQEILTYDGAEDLFQHLLDVYATASGISGVQPKVLIRDVASHKMSRDHKLTVLGATHIVKTWDVQYPQLALNEHFCLSAARYAGLQVPEWNVSQNGKFLILDRFDITQDAYLGVEDLCVLAGMTTDMKYRGSYEQIAKILKIFLSPEYHGSALRDYFKMVALSCSVRNGDAHRKNFCIMYENAESRMGKLAPAFDIVTTTAYMPMDSLALMMGGTKRWPTQKHLHQFAAICGLTSEETKTCLEDVKNGIILAREDLQQVVQDIPEFQKIGTAMNAAWEQGLRSL